MFKNYAKCFSISLLFICNIQVYSIGVSVEVLTKDSLHIHKISEVTVHGKSQVKIKAALPTQIISEKELDLLNATNVSDIAKYFSGVTVKDYGGIGGLKTVSIRGMGAQHTGVCYDGVMLNDAQTGQIDLSKYTLENISEVSLSNSQPNNIFQTARMFAYSGVLCLNTKLLEYNPIKTFDAKITAKTGSFGLANLSVFLNRYFNKKWMVNLSTNALSANGKYKFIQHYGNLSNIAEELTRTNSDICSFRSELNTTFKFNSNSLISLKSNYYTSERGLPANIFYNGFSEQRLKENQFFTQLHYLNKLSNSFQQQILVKFNSSALKYTDLATFSEYSQNEYYTSYSASFQSISGFVTSFSSDWWLNNLNAKSIYNNDFGHPARNTELVNIAAKYNTEQLVVSANLLGTFTQEHVESGVASPNRRKLTPNVSFSYKLFSDKELAIRAFYKNIFRVPTFNDLYYQDFGNINLKPESTNQYNVGVVYLLDEFSFLRDLELSVDGYYNKVTNKIVAIPKDLFRWTMINKGTVEIKGFDFNLKSAIQLKRTNLLLIRMNYTYNKATDKTPDTPNYGEQIPYTPFVSGSGSIALRNKLGEVGYNVLFSGLRWKGQNVPDNLLTAYSEHSVFVSGHYKLINAKAEIINLFNAQYDIVKFYPMPGRNFRITLSTTL